MKTDIAIAHASFAEDRKESLKTLLEQIKKTKTPAHVEVFESPAPEHASVWAKRIYEWIASRGNPVAILNDDVTVCKDFCGVLDRLTDEKPGKPLSLMVTNPEAENKYLQGHDWVRIFHYTGPGVVLYPEHAKALLEWTAKCPMEFKSSQNEDGVACQWAYDTGNPFYAPLPSPINHRTDVLSTLGYDHHAFRTAAVPWGATREDKPKVKGEPPYIENVWRPLEQLEVINQLLKKRCSFCDEHIGIVGKPGKACICPQCVINCMGAYLSKTRYPW